jgi:hypothetical protein
MDKYRVIVLREGDAGDETLFEIAGGAVLIARLVPGALADVLSGDPVAQGEVGAATLTPGGVIAAPGGPFTMRAASAGMADRVFDGAVAAGNAAEAQSAPAGAEPAKPTRTRRTKAQIEADKAAQAAGFRDAAHQAEATIAAGVAASPAPAAYEPAGESVYVAPPGEQVVIAPPAPATPVVLDGAGNAITPVGVGDQPWNPFAQ